MESVIAQGLALIDRQADVVDGSGLQLVVKERPVGGPPRNIGRPQTEVNRMSAMYRMQANNQVSAWITEDL